MRKQLMVLIATSLVGCTATLGQPTRSERPTDPGAQTDPAAPTDPAAEPTSPAPTDPGPAASDPPTPSPPRVVQTTPAISGGSLLVSHDGQFALASDLDRDAVWIVNLNSDSLVTHISFGHGEHPWRMVEDGAGNFHVTLRDAGQVVEIDRSSWTIGARTDVCPAPRGLDYDSSRDAIVVACDTGELVTLPAGGGAPIQTLHFDRDLRDVVVSGNTILVSQFRKADVLDINATTGLLDHVIDLPSVAGATPTVAWRMIATTGGKVLVVHQQAQQDGAVVISQPGGYGGSGESGCAAIVNAAVTVIDADPGDAVASTDLSGVVLPVDIAVAPDNRVEIASAGAPNTDPSMLPPGASGIDARMGVGNGPAVVESTGAEGLLALAGVTHDPGGIFGGSCDLGTPGETFEDGRQVIAVAFDSGGRTITQTREPWEIVIDDPRGGTGAATHIALPGTSNEDRGQELFHRDAGKGVACASCHAEGEEDGHTWTFDTLGPRRTMNLSGGIGGTAPFHWSGDMTDFQMLVNEVFVKRMGGPDLPTSDVDQLESWIDTIPSRPVATAPDAAAVARGRALYEDPSVGCTSCHSGPRLSNNTTVNVGTGLALQVPSLLGIGDRAPYMHNGCAPTLRDRFTDSACGGGDMHGHTSQLSSAQIDDLVAYLNTL